MPVRITTRQCEVPQELQEIVEKKVRRLKKYFDKVDQIDVIFMEEKYRRICEINVKAGPLGATCKEENGDFGPAFEKALKACERQIKESKRRMVDRRHGAVNIAKGTKRDGRLPGNMPEAI